MCTDATVLTVQYLSNHTHFVLQLCQSACPTHCPEICNACQYYLAVPVLKLGFAESHAQRQRPVPFPQDLVLISLHFACTQLDVC